jgi:hypothetical protein
VSVLTGGCLCGDVRYLIADVPVRQAICHCRHCQRQCGTAFSALLIVPTTALDVQGDTRIYQDRGHSGDTVNRHFCNRCGSPIFTALPSRPDMRFIKAGTLDDPQIMAPEVHVWCESAWRSTLIPSAAKTFPKAPSQVS